jgi:hypothetical protein
MGKRENPHSPYLWKSQLSPPSSHLPIAMAYFFLNAPRAFHSKRFNLEMNAGGVLFF